MGGLPAPMPSGGALYDSLGKGQTLELSARSNVAPGYIHPKEQVVGWINKYATENNIDPRVAMTVAQREGLNSFQSSVVKNGVREPSFGPFQLYTGGGMGNDFKRDTGLDPADPKNTEAGIQYAMMRAKEGGWGPWYGAKAAGITGFEGINGKPANWDEARPARSSDFVTSKPASFDFSEHGGFAGASTGKTDDSNPLLSLLSGSKDSADGLLGALGGSQAKTSAPQWHSMSNPSKAPTLQEYVAAYLKSRRV